MENERHEKPSRTPIWIVLPLLLLRALANPRTLAAIGLIATIGVVAIARRDAGKLDGVVGRIALEIANADRVLGDVQTLTDAGERQSALGLLVRLGVRRRSLDEAARERASCLLGRLTHDDPEVDAEYCDLGAQLWPLIPALREIDTPELLPSGTTVLATSTGMIRSTETWSQWGWFVRLHNPGDVPTTSSVQYRWEAADGTILDARNRFDLEVPSGRERIVFGEHVLTPYDSRAVASGSVVEPRCLKMVFQTYCLGGSALSLPLFPDAQTLPLPTRHQVEVLSWEDDPGLVAVVVDRQVVRINRLFSGEGIQEGWDTVRGRIEATYGPGRSIGSVDANRPGHELQPTDPTPEMPTLEIPTLEWRQEGWHLRLFWLQAWQITVSYTVNSAVSALTEIEAAIADQHASLDAQRESLHAQPTTP